jgi:biotin transport system substrate-specific component
MTAIAIKWGKKLHLSWIKTALEVVIASACIALSAPFTLFLPFSPVPVVLQMNVAFFLAYLLGPKKGIFAVGLFLMEGFFGLPVFAGGLFGIQSFIGHRGGYLFGYFIAAYIISNFNPKKSIDYFKMYLLANLAVYFFGFIWLATFIGFYQAFTLGIFPFMVGDFIKNICITKLTIFYKESKIF